MPPPTILDGPVPRSQRPDDIAPEVRALLTVYQIPGVPTTVTVSEDLGNFC
ncbi:MAG: hypothetical protein HKP61_13190 [Dactylosporangium sp.]|nr:hypothetical protein [Dactylosporangium sp.]NNJ61871.1 hypothetical protein [Dactylosporangium sp.]